MSKPGRKLSRETNKLKSAPINNEDINGLSRFRSRMTIDSENEINLNIDKPVPDASKNMQKPTIDRPDSSLIHNNGKPILTNVKIETSEYLKSIADPIERPNDDISNDFQYGDEFDQDDFHEDIPPSTNIAQGLIQENTKKPEKRGRGRPRKISKVEESEPTPKIKRKRGRPRKGTENDSDNQNKTVDTPRRSTRMLSKDIPSYRIEKDSGNKTRSKSAHQKHKSQKLSLYDSEKPVSLAKTKKNETQKPMYINTERIITNQNRDKRLRVNTLDVLKHLIENFNPIISDSQVVNESLIHNEFKNHVLHHLGYLFDAHANINDISQEISEIQKKKTLLRSKIFELKKDHTDIGSKLNKMRGSYQDERSKFKNFNKMTNKLQSLSSIVDGYKSGTRDYSEASEHNMEIKGEMIDKNIFTLSKVVNPNSGMFKKLIIINKKLSKIENELS